MQKLHYFFIIVFCISSRFTSLSFLPKISDFLSDKFIKGKSVSIFISLSSLVIIGGISMIASIYK